MGSPEDTAIRELELRSLQSEAEWFVECEIPKVGRRIKRVLQHCLAFLSPRGTKELELLADLVPRDGDDDILIPSLESTNKLASFETQEGLKGFISVGGWSITGAEISVKFPKWNKGVPLKATVSNSHPWRLYQLQNAYNFVKMTLNELNLLIKQCESAHSNLDPQNLNNNNNNNINNNNINNLSNSTSISSSPLSSSSALSALSALSSSPYSASFSSCSPLHNLAFTQQTALAAVNKVVGQVSKWMALARDSIMLPNKGLLFPHSLASNQGFQGFHPALPQDLHVEFSVCNAEIIISVYALYIGLGPPPSIDTPSQKSQLVASVLSPSANRIKAVPEKGQLSPSSSNSSLGGGMRKNNSVGSLLNNFPATFSNFSHALSNSSSSAHDKSSSSLSSFNSSSSSLSRVDEAHETNVMDITEGSAPSISISSLSNTPSDHRVSIGGTTYRTYSISQRGNPAWVAVLDQSEVHCIVPRVNHTLSLLTHAINSLADIEDKLVALSLL